MKIMKLFEIRKIELISSVFHRSFHSPAPVAVSHNGDEVVIKISSRQGKKKEMNLIRCVRCATCGDKNPGKFNFALWQKLADPNQCASQLRHWLVSRLLQPTPLSAISNNKKRTINFRFSTMEFLRYLSRRPSLIYVDVYVLARCRLAWNDEAAKKKAGSEWNGEEREKYCEKISVRIQKKRN